MHHLDSGQQTLSLETLHSWISRQQRWMLCTGEVHFMKLPDDNYALGPAKLDRGPKHLQYSPAERQEYPIVWPARTYPVYDSEAHFLSAGYRSCMQPKAGMSRMTQWKQVIHGARSKKGCHS